MKKIISFVLFLTLSASSFSQQNNPAPTLTKQDYLEKSKKQKTGAWLLLSGGFVMTTVGAGLAIDDASDELNGALVTLFTFGTVEPVSDDKDNSTISGILLFTGVGSMIGSIPLFKAAKINKRKGMSLSFSNQKIPSLLKSSLVYNSIPSLKLKISL